MNLCYVCGSIDSLTRYRYPDQMKTVCIDCCKALISGVQTYEENAGLVPRTEKAKKRTLEERRKALELMFTRALNENWDNWDLPRGSEAQA